MDARAPRTLRASLSWRWAQSLLDERRLEHLWNRYSGAAVALLKLDAYAAAKRARAVAP